MADEDASDAAWLNELSNDLAPETFSRLVRLGRPATGEIVVPTHAVGTHEQIQELVASALATGTAVSHEGRTWRMARCIEYANEIAGHIDGEPDGTLLFTIKTGRRLVGAKSTYMPLVLFCDLKPTSARRLLRRLLNETAPQLKKWRVHRFPPRWWTPFRALSQ